MNRVIIQSAITAVVLIMLQVLVFNRISLWGVATPLVYTYIFLRLPLKTDLNLVLTIAFVTGLLVDVFSDTPGLNSLVATITSVLRKPMLKLYLPREEDVADPVPSIRSFGLPVFAKYALTFTVVFTALIFTIEAFSLFNPIRLLLKIICSTILTWGLIMAADTLTTPQHAKRL